MNDFNQIQKELLDNKILVNNRKIQRNTTWKRFDISKYGVSANEFWFRVLHPNSDCRCAFCGKDIDFENCYITTKNELFCSKDEAYKLALEKRKQTNLERFGSESALGNKEKKQKCKETWAKKDTSKVIEKREQTIIEKYGSKDAFYMSNFEKIQKTNIEKYGSVTPLGNKKIQEKVKNTCLEKYGAENIFLSEYGKEKIKETCLKKYGVESTAQVPEIRAKQLKSFQEKNIKYALENNLTRVKDLYFEFGTGWEQIGLVKEIKYNNVSFVRNEDISKIKEYYINSIPRGTSHQESELKEFISTLDLEVEFNNREILNGKELDIYIPSKNVAIEFNGLYWHSDKQKPFDYHKIKTELCNQKGIRLIHIFEDEWQNNKDIIKSIIKSSLGIYDRKIYARKCEIKELNNKEYKDFLIKNHIQGQINSSLKVGLFYKNELVQVAGFGKSRFKSNELELHRMCTLLNTQVIGGFSKLCKYLNQPFISYIDKSKFNGKGYEACGFKVLSETPPSYSYYYRDSLKKYNRMSFQKSKLKSFSNYSEEKTEKQIMDEAGFLRVYDCGTIKVKYGS